MRKARSSRHQWFNTKSKVNLLRWLVCLAVQVAHHGFSWIILFVFLFSQLSLLAAAVLPCLPFQFCPYSGTYTLQQNLLKGDDTPFNARKCTALGLHPDSVCKFTYKRIALSLITTGMHCKINFKLLVITYNKLS